MNSLIDGNISSKAASQHPLRNSGYGGFLTKKMTMNYRTEANKKYSRRGALKERVLLGQTLRSFWISTTGESCVFRLIEFRFLEK